VGLRQNRRNPIKYNTTSLSNTMEISQEAMDAFKKREFTFPLTIKHIEYVLAKNKNELIEKKYSRFIGLNTSKCQEYLADDTLCDVIKDTVKKLKPYANPKQVQQRGRPSTKRKHNDVHQQKSNRHFHPVSATVNKDFMMLL
jgi:hypothetical protein